MAPDEASRTSVALMFFGVRPGDAYSASMLKLLREVPPGQAAVAAAALAVCLGLVVGRLFFCFPGDEAAAWAAATGAVAAVIIALQIARVQGAQARESRVSLIREAASAGLDAIKDMEDLCGKFRFRAGNFDLDQVSHQIAKAQGLTGHYLDRQPPNVRLMKELLGLHLLATHSHTDIVRLRKTMRDGWDPGEREFPTTCLMVEEKMQRERARLLADAKAVLERVLADPEAV